jgi:hypothetical protein
MNQTRFKNINDTGDESSCESSVPQSPSKSSMRKSSGSSKASTSSWKLLPVGYWNKKTEKRPDQVIPTSAHCPYVPPPRSKSIKRPEEQVIPSLIPYRSTEKDKFSTETPEEKLKRKREKKTKSSNETPEEKLKRKKDKKERKNGKEEKKEKKSKSKDSSETPEEKAQRRNEKKEKKGNKKDEKNLMGMIKTLQHRVEEVESENRRLNVENTAMQDLETHLNQAEEQLEYATEENHEFSTRVHALEQALVAQETELDNALATIRKQAKRNRKSENKIDSLTADAELAKRAQLEEQLAFSEELEAVQEEMELLRHERDRAVERSIKSKIQSGNLKAEVSESYDRVTECKVVIEELRTLWQNSLNQHSSSADRRSSVSSVSSFSSLPISTGLSTLGSLWGFSNKDDEKSTVSKCDDDSMLDHTEENTSEGSEEDWDLEQTDFPLQ